MATKIGYRYDVKLRIESKHWYPDQGGTQENARVFVTEKCYKMVCNEVGITACDRMIETLLPEDYGAEGVHSGRGTSLLYVVDNVEFKGEVRLSSTPSEHTNK